MQVKKFEAKTMKEALQLVKSHLGPEAIILNAKDVGNSLKTGVGVEVTAAVSESTLRKKQLAEKKLREEDRERFRQFSAKKQKEFIDKAFQVKAKGPERPPTRTPYVDIPDERSSQKVAPQAAVTVRPTVRRRPQPAPVESPMKRSVETPRARERIQNATRRAVDQFSSFKPEVKKQTPQHKTQPQKSAVEPDEIRVLKQEISRLRQVIDKFQAVPQNFVSQHPGAEEGFPYALSFIYERLANAGFNRHSIVQILKALQKGLDQEQWERKPLVNAWVAKHILEQTEIVKDPFAKRMHAFAGPSGHGKTTTLVKIASHLVLDKKKSIGVIGADTGKVGACEALRTYCQILNVPFFELRALNDLPKIMEQLAEASHILIDMPGSTLARSEDIEKLQQLIPQDRDQLSFHLVLSMLAKDRDAFEIGNRYEQLKVDDVIFTGLDESTQHGLIYNIQSRFHWPLHSFGTGPQIPEDFELATKERVIDLIFKLSKLKREQRAI